jgi:putative nucleotidyltransferase with HDIG domain
MGTGDLRFRVYAIAITVAAAAGFVASWLAGSGIRIGPLFLTLVVAIIVSELLAVELPNGAGISLTYPLLVSAIVLLGPTAAATLAAVSMIPAFLQGSRGSLLRTVGNLGQMVLTALVPGWLYLAASGYRLFSDAPLDSGSLGGMVLPLLLAAWVGVGVNAALFGVGYGMIHHVSWRGVWRLVFSWTLASQFVLSLLGLAIAQVMAVEGAPGFALFVIPLLVAHQIHRRYLALRETYADTVGSLVAAIEAKDPYTKGHSLRVARFAGVIAIAMGLKEGDIERLEYAALLHDLGKIGISRSILSKPSALSDAEYEKIREHPDIGARILESVPFLDDVRPVVQNHHERVDGAGYGHGLASGDIPLAARILAVADSFDAMTAERPYRRALAIDAAIAELRAGSGSQFDPQIVEVLIAALPGIEAEVPNGATGIAEGVPGLA